MGCSSPAIGGIDSSSQTDSLILPLRQKPPKPCVGANREGESHGEADAPIADSWFFRAHGGRNSGASLYRQCAGEDGGSLVDAGLRAGGGSRDQEDRRRIREGQRQ